MGVIGFKEMFQRGFSLLLGRVAPVGIVRLLAVGITMGVGAWGTRGLLETLRSVAPEETAVTPQNLSELFNYLPQEQLMDIVFAPGLWFAVIVNIIVFLWAQGAVYMALYPNPRSENSGEPRSLPAVLIGAVGLLFPLALVNIFYGVLVLIGFVLLFIPGIWLAVKYSFAPLLLVVEDGATAFTAFGRSNDLVKGHWWAVFLRLLAVGVVVMLGNLAFSFIPFVGAIVAGVIFPPFLNACQLALLESLKSADSSEVPEAEPATV
ncbi:MAG: hypothetical protein HY547_03420 [Elusimicrobia bacterium]|nr:hypothetical protein [Elusimicrobiota bacterium]